MSQLGMTTGGGSPAHGDTLCPWDTRRSSGGSSAGEAALVAGGAAIFGLGSDVGGSVRVPAAYCGICAMKPTVGRMSAAGPSHKGGDLRRMRSCIGILRYDMDAMVTHDFLQ